MVYANSLADCIGMIYLPEEKHAQGLQVGNKKVHSA